LIQIFYTTGLKCGNDPLVEFGEKAMGRLEFYTGTYCGNEYGVRGQKDGFTTGGTAHDRDVSSRGLFREKGLFRLTSASQHNDSSVWNPAHGVEFNFPGMKECQIR